MLSGPKKFLETVLPKTLSPKGTITSPPSIIGLITMPVEVLQSSSLITRSWATSTSLLVKYPEFAVLSAVSANPFLAPWVEIKYCWAVRPSLKFAVIGVSIIDPSGFAINPLIPASCLIWAGEPLAPESANMKTELKESVVTRFPSESFTSSVEILSIIALAIISLALDQISMTLLYFSPLVTRPEANWASISLTSFSASITYFSFSSGITKSSIHKEAPDFVENW